MAGILKKILSIEESDDKAPAETTSQDKKIHNPLGIEPLDNNQNETGQGQDETREINGLETDEIAFPETQDLDESVIAKPLEAVSYTHLTLPTILLV